VELVDRREVVDHKMVDVLASFLQCGEDTIEQTLAVVVALNLCCNFRHRQSPASDPRSTTVIPVLVTGIHLSAGWARADGWIPGTRPGMIPIHLE